VYDLRSCQSGNVWIEEPWPNDLHLISLLRDELSLLTESAETVNLKPSTMTA
jgi:hypothetical protein